VCAIISSIEIRLDCRKRGRTDEYGAKSASTFKTERVSGGEISPHVHRTSAVLNHGNRVLENACLWTTESAMKACGQLAAMAAPDSQAFLLEPGQSVLTWEAAMMR